MCGITAFTGKEEALPFLMQGLSKLEYRGYDSTGITLVNSKQLLTFKTKGRLSNLSAVLKENQPKGCTGIGHTRWATHGIPSNLNSHPHTNESNTISLVHNGIIENYKELKDELLKKKYTFISDTDSEVIVHLIDSLYHGDLKETIKEVTTILKGSYALCIISSLEPDTIYITKKDSPIVIAKNDNACFAASDIPAILDYSKEVYFLEDLEMAQLTPNTITFFDAFGNRINKEIITIPYDNEAAQKGGFDTFMHKEIFDQPHVIKETMRGRIQNNTIYLEELENITIDFSNFNNVYFVACGTAYNACLSEAPIFEKMTGIPTHCQVASEFRYNDSIINEKTLAIFVSQSGETADTMAALRLAKQKGATTLAIANVIGSSLSREALASIYTWAGSEIAVASTKAYTTQCIVILLLSMYVAQKLGNTITDYEDILHQLQSISDSITAILKDKDIFKKQAALLVSKQDAYYIGRGLDYASVLEGSLKLKEVSYIHADAYMAGELKHGPIALIEPDTIVIAVASQPNIASKTISNIQETVSRGAHVILFTTSEQEIPNVSDVYHLPNVHPILQPIVVAIPLQLLAYYTAKGKGCDIDKPRNLAKSVTVE
jgi:glucosamine--fructose-6-phosphate aminotransferase (isomerizing)